MGQSILCCNPFFCTKLTDNRVFRWRNCASAAGQIVRKTKGSGPRTRKVSLARHLEAGQLFTRLARHIREYHNQGEEKRISQIIDQLVELFATPSNPLHVRNGGLIGLAGTAIALLTDIAPYMERFIDPLLVCFSDAESRIRYFSAECLYNIAKVSKGEILVYFNQIFDGLSKVSHHLLNVAYHLKTLVAVCRC